MPIDSNLVIISLIEGLIITLIMSSELNNNKNYRKRMNWNDSIPAIIFSDSILSPNIDS